MKLDLLLRGACSSFPTWDPCPVRSACATGASSILAAGETAEAAGDGRLREQNWVMPGIVDPHVHFGFGSPETDFLTESRSGGARRRDVGAVVLPHRRLPHGVRRVSRPRGVAELHRFPDCTSASRATPWRSPRRVRKRFGVTSYKLYRGAGARPGSRKASPGDRRCVALRGVQSHRRHRGRGARHPLRTLRSFPTCASRCTSRDATTSPRGTSRAPTSSRPRTCIACYFASRQEPRSTSLHLSSREALDEVSVIAAARDAAARRDVPALSPARRRAARACSPKVNPPIRGRADVDAMWEGIADGSIDTVGTDHVPQAAAPRKARASGRRATAFPAWPTMLPILIDEGHHRRGIAPGALRRCFRATPRGSIACEARARSPGQVRCRHHGGRSSPGADGRPRDARIVHGLDYSPYEGRTLKGWPVATYVRGRK